MKNFYIVFCLFCLTAQFTFAQDYIEVGGIIYTVDGSEATVKGKWSDRDYGRPDPSASNNYSGDIVIPSSFIYEGKTYTVRSIGYMAFASASSVLSVKLPNTITSIGEDAFSSKRKTGYFNGGKAPQITSMVIPINVEKIGNNAFYHCDSLRNIILPENLKSISSGAFYSCDKLKEVQLPSWLESIGYGAFSNSGLEKIYIPNSVKEIGVNALDSKAIREIKVAPNNAAFSDIDGVLFNRMKTSLIYYPRAKGIDRYEIPQSVTTIEDDAFSYTNKLLSLLIPSSVNKVECTFNTNSISGIQYIYCKAQNPPACKDIMFNTSATTTIKLFVPRHSKTLYENTDGWNRCIISEDLAKAEIKMQRNSATFVIGKEKGTKSYRIGLYLDTDFSELVMLVNLDANGNEVFLQTEDDVIEYTFNNLQPDKAYFYQILALDDNGGQLAEQQGRLYYDSSTASIDNSPSSSPDILYRTDGNKLVIKNTLDKKIEIFDLNGRCVKSLRPASETTELTLDSGMYIIRTGSNSMKVIIK